MHTMSINGLIHHLTFMLRLSTHAYYVYQWTDIPSNIDVEAIDYRTTSIINMETSTSRREYMYSWVCIKFKIRTEEFLITTLIRQVYLSRYYTHVYETLAMTASFHSEGRLGRIVIELPIPDQDSELPCKCVFKTMKSDPSTQVTKGVPAKVRTGYKHHSIINPK